MPTLLAHAAKACVGSANAATTAAIDTTGASFLVVAATRYGGVPVLSDSAGNTWSALTDQASVNTNERLFYVASPTTSATHTFTVAASNAAALAVAAFSGVAGVLDGTTGAVLSFGSGSTLQTGSITPATSGDLIVTGLGIDSNGNTPTINLGFTITDTVAWVSGNNEGIALAYLVQATAAAINPTWTFSGNAQLATTIAAFTPSAGAAAPASRPVTWPQAMWRSAYR